MFITIDGPNGCGKSSLVKALVSQLHVRGIKTIATCEPTVSVLGKFLRSEENSFSGTTLACLVAADRYHHLKTEIDPALRDGWFVVSDRYVESSFVLQSLDGVDWNLIWDINRQVAVPHLSVNLYASCEELRKRLRARKSLTRFERMERSEDELALYERARNFLSTHGFNHMVLNSESQSTESLCNEIIERLVNM